MTELASEDNFRLNVLLANKPQAIRIDESRMVVYGLSEKGEAKVSLNPSGRPEQYVKAVKELISGHILGSPGGYPIYLRRWTRMGQMRDESLEQLLMLGEQEAVVAAVCSPGLTDELARRAWWAMEDAENARRMLCNPAIVGGTMGPVLADYLLEFLPFETETEKMTESVRLILQPGLVDEGKRIELRKKSGRRQAYLVGFLQALPDELPEPVSARADLADLQAALEPLVAAGNAVARALLRVLSAAGQTYLDTLTRVLAKPPTQDVVHNSFDTVRDYFSPLRPEGDPDLTVAALQADAQGYAGGGTGAQGVDPAVRACLDAAPAFGPEIAAMRLLSGLGYGALRPALRDSTAMGSLMRRKLAPVLDPVATQVAVLRGRKGG
jgi:hypothetical protein